jgi:predicted ATP-dependent endonuclease of OLD family
VGENNSGKSTVIECIRLLTKLNENPSIPVGQRNTATDRKIRLKLIWNDASEHVLETTRASQTKLTKVSHQANAVEYIPARRSFNHTFGKGLADSHTYRIHLNQGPLRNPGTHNLTTRLQEIHNNAAQYEAFNVIIARILGKTIEWEIEGDRDERYFLDIKSGKYSHDSEGLGDGIISVFFIANALLESDKPDQRVTIILLDEPELSLHASIQKRLMRIFKEYAQHKQIIIATHSAHFFDFESIFNGATLQRVYKEEDGSISIGSLRKETIEAIKSLHYDRSNPHILGLEAREAFFLLDGIVLLEGQEDAFYYPKIAESLGKEYRGEIYGWGAGGAGNVEHLCNVFKDLGYLKVFCILDKNKEYSLPSLKQKFPDYEFRVIPADDVRDKINDRTDEVVTEGVLESTSPNITVKEKYKAEMISLIKEENSYNCRVTVLK